MVRIVLDDDTVDAIIEERIMDRLFGGDWENTSES